MSLQPSRQFANNMQHIHHLKSSQKILQPRLNYLQIMLQPPQKNHKISKGDHHLKNFTSSSEPRQRP